MDAKGRMALPALYRDTLLADCEGKLVITISTTDKCLMIYPRPEWDERAIKLRALPTLNARTRRVQRLLLGHAREVEMDASGRIPLSPELRSFAQLEKKLMLVGLGHRFELWAADRWDRDRDDWIDEEAEATETDMPDELKTLSL